MKLDCEEKTLAQEISKKGSTAINTLAQEHWAAQKITCLQHFVKSLSLIFLTNLFDCCLKNSDTIPLSFYPLTWALTARINKIIISTPFLAATQMSTTLQARTCPQIFKIFLLKANIFANVPFPNHYVFYGQFVIEKIKKKKENIKFYQLSVISYYSVQK